MENKKQNENEKQIKKHAQLFATKHHENQLRKDNLTPYITHPIAVAKYVQDYGRKYPELNISEETICAALLHDTIEDTSVTYEDIEKEFGKSIADKVQLLTRVDSKYRSKEESRRIYKLKIKNNATPDVQLVKICDVIHNVETLGNLSPEGIKRKINDCNNIYIPMAQKLCFEAGKKLEGLINNYLRNIQ